MANKEKILNRITKSINGENAFKHLSEEISASNLQSLLLNLFEKRAGKISPASVLSSYENSRFCRTTNIPQKKFIEFDKIAYSTLPNEFEGIELSPVAPLGSVSSFARVNQNNPVTTIRNTEVISDPTNILALEAALRKRKISDKALKSININLATSHRVLRAQTFDDPASFAHFKLFSMITAGRDKGSFQFENESLLVHLQYYFHLFDELKENEYSIGGTKLKLILFDEKHLTWIKEKFIPELKKNLPKLIWSIEIKPAVNFDYYKDLRFQIFFDYGKEELLLVDGGFTDWTQVILSDKKERLLISGLGTERLIYCFSQ